VAQRSPLLPIFLIVLVDVLGFTIVIPLLGFYAEHFNATPLVATTIVSVYAVCSLISTPLIGNLSDRYGRRPLLLVSQAGTCAGFLILAFSSALWMVFLGRILDGITAGNLSIAQAYISDHTRPENRAKAFGVIGIAFGIGFAFGPLIGGELRGYGIHVPFVLAACLSALSMICTYTLLPRGLPPQKEPSAAAEPAGRRPSAFDFRIYAEYFRRPGLAPIYLQFFLFAFAFSCFTSGFALFAERRFLWSEHQVGRLFAFTGVLGIILQGGLIGRLVKRYGEVALGVAGFIAAATAYALLGVVQSLAAILITAAISSFGNGVLRPVITSRITQAVDRHEQGVALGISGSLSSLAMALAPPTGGALLNEHWLVAWALVPATVAALGLIASLARRPATPAGATPAAALSSQE
jgi:DHA1 family tetracycline resistance protein-like MFS transporter